MVRERIKMDQPRVKIHGSLGDRVFLLFVYGAVVFIFLATLYPIIFIFSSSISDPLLVATGKVVLLPKQINFSGYEHLFKNRELWVGYGNSLFYTVAGTILNLIVTLSAGYALSRKDMIGRNLIMGIFVFTMYFSGGLIPLYLNYRSFGLLNSRTVMLIVSLLSVYNLIVCRTFFASTIPWELHEACMIDGASDFTVFFRIVLPLSKPVMTVMSLYYGVTHWNGYFNAMIYLRDRDKFPLQLFLREILIQSQLLANAAFDAIDAEAMKEMAAIQDMANLLKFCVIMVATLPMLMIYPFLQRYFEKGVLIGSLKG